MHSYRKESDTKWVVYYDGYEETADLRTFKNEMYAVAYVNYLNGGPGNFPNSNWGLEP